MDVIANYGMARAGVLAGAALHRRLLDQVLRWPLRLFETTSVGSVLNRFTADLACVDLETPFVFRSVINCVLHLLSTCVAVGLASPYALIVSAPIAAVLYVYIQVGPRAGRPVDCAKIGETLHQTGA